MCPKGMDAPPPEKLKHKYLIPSFFFFLFFYFFFALETKQAECLKKSKRKVQGVPQSQTAAQRKPTNPNKHKSNKRTKSTKISSLFSKRGNRNAKRTEKHKNKQILTCSLQIKTYLF